MNQMNLCWFLNTISLVSGLPFDQIIILKYKLSVEELYFQINI